MFYALSRERKEVKNVTKNPDFSYINKDGKRVAGAVAFNHHVFTEMGGIQQYNDAVGIMYIEAFIQANSDYINTEVTAQARRKRLKLVG